MQENRDSDASDLFPPSEFYSWAKSYDDSINDGSGFPFDGYYNVLKTIIQLSGAKEGDEVIDLGTGTGNLAARFAAIRSRVWGLDFSREMLERARQKLHQAVFAQADLRSEWPPEFQRKFDHIVSAYTFHHFPLGEKVRMVRHLLEHYLESGGSLVIADLAFQNAVEQEQMRHKLGEEWEDEFYWIADETFAVFWEEGVRGIFTKVSSCAGVFKFWF
jgi:putative AdoMet-dependent methyltransferase